MQATKEILKIDQVFATKEDGSKTLRRLLIHDNDVAYDVIWNQKGLSFIRLLSRGPEGVFYEIASKNEENPVVNRYDIPPYRGSIYENKNAFGERESFVAAAHSPDGAVRGAIVLAADFGDMNVLYDKGWASFELTEDGAQYVQESDINWMAPKTEKTKVVLKKSHAVLIDGQRKMPLERPNSLMMAPQSDVRE